MFCPDLSSISTLFPSVLPPKCDTCDSKKTTSLLEGVRIRVRERRLLGLDTLCRRIGWFAMYVYHFAYVAKKKVQFSAVFSLFALISTHIYLEGDELGRVQKEVAPKRGVRCDQLRNECGGLCHLFEFLHLRENEEEGEQAKTSEYTPNNHERNFAPQERRNNGEEITDGSSHKPTTHHHTLVFGRSDLRHKGDAHRRKEEFGEGEDEISKDEPVG